VGVRPEDRRHAAVEVPAHRHLLAGQLGVEVDDERVGGAGERVEQLVDRGERVAVHPHVHLAAQADHGDPHAGRLDDRVAPAGVARGEVRRAHDPAFRVQVRIDVPVAVGVVAERDHVGPGVEDLARRLGGDPDPSGHVLAVDDDEVGQPLCAELGHRPRQCLSTRLADDVPYEEEAHSGAA